MLKLQAKLLSPQRKFALVYTLSWENLVKASQFLSSVCRAILFLWLICRVCLSVHGYLTVFHGTCVLKRFREGGFQTQLYSALMPCTPHYSTWRRKRLRDSKSVGLVVSHAAWGRASGLELELPICVSNVFLLSRPKLWQGGQISLEKSCLCHPRLILMRSRVYPSPEKVEGFVSRDA